MPSEAVVDSWIEELESIDIVPFNKAVKSRVEFIMMAHLQVDAIDSELPTSLSKKAYDILRKQLKFKKIAITDDMQMQAITDKYSIEEAVARHLMQAILKPSHFH